jgi:hypothetical protein
MELTICLTIQELAFRKIMKNVVMFSSQDLALLHF